MQFKKIYKTETRNVVYLVILQILVLDLLNNFIDNEHKVSRKYVNLFRTIDLFKDGVADYSPVGESAIFVESLTQHRASPKMNKTPTDNNLIIESNETIYNAAYNT